MPSQKLKKRSIGGTVSGYVSAQKGNHGAICRLLRREIAAGLPKAKARLYHAVPVWFIWDLSASKKGC